MTFGRTLSGSVDPWLTSIKEEEVDSALRRSALGKAVDGDLELLDHAATVYELIALQLFLSEPSSISAQAQSYATKAYQCRSRLPVPRLDEGRVEELLAYTGMAIVAGAGDQVARRLKLEDFIGSDEVDVPWDEYLARRLLGAWALLGVGRDGREAALFTVRRLLAEQSVREGPFLERVKSTSSAPSSTSPLLRLAALYHLAQATQDIATVLDRRSPGDPRLMDKLDLHFAQALRVADPMLGRALSWLRIAATRLMAL